MKRALRGRSPANRVLDRLIEAPHLVQTVRSLPPAKFSALIRHVGLEDAGELIALATTEQLVAAFDEDLFRNDGAGERETFDRSRFVTWLEVLLEAGDSVAAARVSELSDNFVVHALSSILLVVDHDDLMSAIGEGGEDAELADKAIEASLSEEIDGYLLVSRESEGWDAALSLILALDRDRREFLSRVLSRAARLGSRYVDDLEALTELLSESESLAEDVEAEREERRAEQGFVEPRAARGFLALAQRPLGSSHDVTRDVTTKAYFRALSRRHREANTPVRASPEPEALLEAIDELSSPALFGERSEAPAEDPAAAARPLERPEQYATPLAEALQLLARVAPIVFAERMEELAYLANVIVAGASHDAGRFDGAQGAEAALATVGFGAELEARAPRQTTRATASDLCDVLHKHHADILFRRAVSTLFESGAPNGLLRSHAELEAALAALRR